MATARPPSINQTNQLTLPMAPEGSVNIKLLTNVRGPNKITQ